MATRRPCSRMETYRAIRMLSEDTGMHHFLRAPLDGDPPEAVEVAWTRFDRDVVARWDGEEFHLVLTEVEVDSVRTLEAIPPDARVDLLRRSLAWCRREGPSPCDPAEDDGREGHDHDHDHDCGEGEDKHQC